MTWNVLVRRATREALAASDLDIVVIGGGGWIGRATLDLLWTALEPDAFARRVHVVGSAERSILIKPGLEIRSAALADWRELRLKPCLVFHNAFLTRDKVGGLPAAAYIEQNRTISRHVLKLSHRAEARAIVMPSSGAAHAKAGGLETDFGANPYGALKAEDEAAFDAFAREHDVALAVPRVFALSGEYINKQEIYALATMIDDVRSSRPIRIRARHRMLRAYIYVGDLIALCLAISLAPAPVQETFDTAARPAFEIEDLARAIATALGHPDHPIERSRDPGLPDDAYVGDPARLEALCREHGIALLPMEEQIRRTASYMAACAPA